VTRAVDDTRLAGPIPFARQPAAHGTQWLARGYAMFRKARMHWVLLLFVYYGVLVLADLVPLIGGFAAPILKPVFAVGFLAAAWTQERGGMPGVTLLFRGFRSNVVALVILGVALVDGGKLFALLANPMPQDLEGDAAALRVQETLGDTRVQLGMAVGALCGVPVLLALWWAPALVVFQDASAAKALATSLRAALANWPSIVRYALAVLFFGLVLPMIAGTVIAAVLPDPIGRAVALALMLPYVFFFVATLHISDYVSYRDVFHAGETPPPDGPAASA
jgi:hypothetical protein